MQYSANSGYRCGVVVVVVTMVIVAESEPFIVDGVELSGVQAHAMAVSPDGAFVVGVDAATGTTTLYARHGVDGGLVGLDSVGDGFEADDSDPFLRDVLWHSSGFVFALSFGDHAVHTLTVDTSAGTIAHTSSVAHSVNGIDSLAGAIALCASPDGAYLYTAAMFSGAVTAFSLDHDTGELTFVDSDRNGDRGAIGMNGLSDIVVSPDGRFVYVAGRAESAIAILEFYPEIGALAFANAVFAGSVNEGLESVTYLSLSPDGATLVASGGSASGMAIYDRDEISGALTFRQSFYPMTGDDEIGSGPVAFVGDGSWLLMSDRHGSSVGLLRRTADGSYERWGDMVLEDLEDGVIALSSSPDDGSAYAVLRDGRVSVAERVYGEQVVGKVVDGTTGFARGDAAVVLEGAERFVSFAGADGVYSFDVVAVGVYELGIHATGYEPAYVSVSIDSHEGLVLPEVSLIAVDDGVAGELFNVETSTPIPGALVVAVDGDGLVVWETYSDSLGRFGYAEGLSTEASRIACYAVGYVDAEVVLDGDFLSIGMLPVASGVGFVTGTLEGLRAGEITPDIDGRVLVQGPISVVVYPDSSGYFVTPLLPEGQYAVYAMGPYHATGHSTCGVGAFDADLSFTLDVAPTPSDVDVNGVVNSADVQIVINEVLNGAGEFTVDINGDKSDDALDIQGIIMAVLKG